MYFISSHLFSHRKYSIVLLCTVSGSESFSSTATASKPKARGRQSVSTCWRGRPAYMDELVSGDSPGYVRQVLLTGICPQVSVAKLSHLLRAWQGLRKCILALLERRRVQGHTQNQYVCLLGHQRKSTHRTKDAEDTIELLEQKRSETFSTKKWEKLLLQLPQPHTALHITLKWPEIIRLHLDHDLKGLLGKCL